MPANAERSLKFAVAALVLLTALALFGPAYRSLFLFEINMNEAWYAYHAQAILESRPLYPSADELITNNYPPLSFYIMALLLKLTGGSIWAGRLLSFGALMCLALEIFVILRLLGVRALFSVIASLSFVATMARLFDDFVWVNDYQLLAHAVMTFGFFCFVRAHASGSRWFVGPALLMVLAGFFKHNIVAMPIASFLILASESRMNAARFAAVGVALAGAGLVTCVLYFGPELVANVFAPRPYSAFRGLKAFEDLHKMPVQLIVWALYAATMSDGSRGRIVNILCVVGFVESIVMRGAEEVHYNACFDFVIALHLGLGAALERIAKFGVFDRSEASAVPALVVAGIAVRLVFGGTSDSFNSLYSAAFRDRFALAAVTTIDEANRVRALPGDVFCESLLICYLAGKPFVVDPVNVRLRMSIGALPPDALDRRLSTGDLTYAGLNPKALVGNR
jgi:hypothetical protein